MGEDASKVSASFFPGGVMPPELAEAFEEAVSMRQLLVATDAKAREVLGYKRRGRCYR